MKIYIGADHNGYEMKAALAAELKRGGYEVFDRGDQDLRPEDDFPVFAARVIVAMKGSDDPEPRGILICGSGQGMCIAANRYKGIRGAVVWDSAEARASRNDDDCNVLCLPSRYITIEEAIKLTSIWLATPFAGASRFKRRIQELDKLG